MNFPNQEFEAFEKDRKFWNGLSPRLCFLLDLLCLTGSSQVLRKDAHGLSAVNPDKYAKRFLDSIKPLIVK